MRRLLALSIWLIATVGVTYVASAAVTLVDLQVFPQGQRVEVLARPAPPPTTTILPTNTATPSSKTDVTTASSTTVEPSTTTTPVSSMTVEPAPTTSVAPVAPATTLPVPPLTIEVVNLEFATVGSGFETSLVSTGGQRPHTWSMASGVLPPGLSLSSAGRVSGTPQSAGRFSFSVRVSDGSGRSADASFAATVVGALRVLTTSLPEVEVGGEYLVALQATGGLAPYNWVVADGQLPDGLVLSTGGAISGTPVGGAPATMVLAVTDVLGQVARSVELAVAYATDRRTVAARGGTVFVDVLGESVSLFLASPADGFSAIVVEPGGFRVEVQFVPLQGDATSWVVCEVGDAVVCRHG